MTEARQETTEPHRIQNMATPTHPPQATTSRGKQAAPSTPRPPTRRDGARKRDDEGANRWRAKRMTMKGHHRAVSKQIAETDDIMMTSQERARRAAWPSRATRSENGNTARQVSRKPQQNRIIPEEMLNSGANRNNTKITGNETPPGKQRPHRPAHPTR